MSKDFQMNWIEILLQRTEEIAGQEIREKVQEGKETLPPPNTTKAKKEIAEWIAQAIERLNKYTDEKKRNEILVATCPHTYPKKRIREMRTLFEQLGSIDELIKEMSKDTSWGGASYYDHPERVGALIYISKVPYNPKAYRNAETEEEKKSAYCHCPIVRKTGMSMSSTICCCSGGWDKQLWEGILGEPLQVKLAKSILKGDDCCVHVIKIPAHFVEGESRDKL
ncbi:MAG: hypothetical protein HXS44_00635 [Theionarchaea archaeon]|nr:hypothetical protein [Theionarchaea archaeon]